MTIAVDWDLKNQTIQTNISVICHLTIQEDLTCDIDFIEQVLILFQAVYTMYKSFSMKKYV